MPRRPIPRRSRDELLELYKIAMDEYRFQVNLNWSRTQYYLALNVAILGTATGILQLAKSSVGRLISGIYIAGAVCCALCLAASQVQHEYYKQARDHKSDIERLLNLGQLSLKTTPGMGSDVHRRGRVATFNNVTLFIVAAVDIFGAVISLIRSF